MLHEVYSQHDPKPRGLAFVPIPLIMGLSSACNSDHGTTWFIPSRNISRRDLHPYFSKLTCAAASPLNYNFVEVGCESRLVRRLLKLGDGFDQFEK